MSNGLLFVLGVIAAVSEVPKPASPSPAPAAAAGLARELRLALEGTHFPEGLRIDAECAREGGYQSVTIFGDGLGVWDGSRQFRLPRPALDGILRAFERYGFFAMEATYGGRRAPQPAVITVTCSVALSMGAHTRQVVQLARGAQSPQLRRLAEAILGPCEPVGRTGTAAATLREGLAKIASGTLAPETLTITANRPAVGSAQGWLLRLRACRLSAQSVRATEGYGESRWLQMRREDVAALARQLEAHAVSELPAALSLPGYTELRVNILGRTKEIQARPFAGRASAASSEAARFESIRAALERLHERAQREGKPEPREAGEEEP